MEKFAVNKGYLLELMHERLLLFVYGVVVWKVLINMKFPCRYTLDMLYHPKFEVSYHNKLDSCHNHLEYFYPTTKTWKPTNPKQKNLEANHKQLDV